MFEFKNSLETAGNTTATYATAVVNNILTSTTLCATMPDITYNGITIQACNLGAIYVGTNANSYGTHFQWGNGFGFQGSQQNGHLPNRSTAVVNAVAHGPINPFSSATYIHNNNNFWDSSNNRNLWG
jgi:hypothetical protein